MSKEDFLSFKNRCAKAIQKYEVQTFEIYDGSHWYLESFVDGEFYLVKSQNPPPKCEENSFNCDVVNAGKHLLKLAGFEVRYKEDVASKKVNIFANENVIYLH